MTEYLQPYFGRHVMEPQFEKHYSMRSVKMAFPKEVSEYTCLTMIRDPFDRFASLHKGYSPKCTLNEMVDEIVSGRLNIKTYAFYWSLQRWLCDVNGELLANRIFRLEDGFKPVVQLLNKLGAPVEIEDMPHINKGVFGADTIKYQEQRAMCSDKTIQAIKELYAWDYYLFDHVQTDGRLMVLPREKDKDRAM